MTTTSYQLSQQQSEFYYLIINIKWIRLVSTKGTAHRTFRCLLGKDLVNIKLLVLYIKWLSNKQYSINDTKIENIINLIKTLKIRNSYGYDGY